MRDSHSLCRAAPVCEVKDVHHIIGANAEDYVSYPDCRPESSTAMQETLRRGSQKLKDLVIHTPFIHWRKAQIVAPGFQLGASYELTGS